MFREVIVPTKENHIIDIPSEFFGQKVEVVIQKTNQSFISKEARLLSIRDVFDGKRIDLSKYKFDRTEANNYE
ncbi:MAG: hypothetical protein SFY32_01660 [Bacteroidota bacterium]|nr:hypothetical protein [Bacteroidota bacterium]